MDDWQHTLQRTETTVHDELQIAELALSESEGRESLRLSSQLVVAGSIAGEKVLKDTTVGRVGHCERMMRDGFPLKQRCDEKRKEGKERKGSGGSQRIIKKKEKSGGG